MVEMLEAVETIIQGTLLILCLWVDILSLGFTFVHLVLQPSVGAVILVQHSHPLDVLVCDLREVVPGKFIKAFVMRGVAVCPRMPVQSTVVALRLLLESS